ncbi:MAG: hypothetical protein RR068_05035 [Hafnia sp.]
MTPEQAKALQKHNARLRSKQAPRRSSQQALSSETQSEVTERAPNMYRVPQINVPDDLQGVTRLIQQELQKIESSQSILLSLWEKLKDQANTATAVEINKTLKVIGNEIFIQRDPASQAGYYGFTDAQPVTTAYFGYPDVGYDMNWYNGLGSNSIQSYGNIMLEAGLGGLWGGVGINANTTYAPPLQINDYTASYGSDNMMLRFNMSGVMRWQTGPYLGDWSVHAYDNTGAWVAEALRCDNGEGQLYSYGHLMARSTAVEAQINMSIALSREEWKAEIYAELLELNPGIVIPKND